MHNMLNIDNIDMDCPLTWALLSEGNTKGCFQLESRLGQSMSKKLKPSNIEELAALISIMRPGCISENTKILVSYKRHSDGNLRNQTITMEELYKKPNKYNHIISYDETSGKLISNKILNVIDNGKKECFKIKIQTNERKTNNIKYNWYDLECTDDHQLLTPNGWVELKDIRPGTRILVVKKKNKPKKIKKKIKSRHSSKLKIDNIDGIKSYRSRCYNHYEYKCVLCDWNKGSLDVNHISGNRHSNNSVDNLCYLCPNHHREYSEGNISSDTLLKEREKHRLYQSLDCKWATFISKVSTGYKKVYDISMQAPHHNFIAGNIVVHNCLEAVREGKTVSQHFIDKKNGQESIDYFHPALESVLQSTYGEMVYQEQAMQIAEKIAGFNLQQADELRKSIGKKNTELMAKVKGKFLSGAKTLGVVTEAEAEQIFSWIEKSQRYSFNKSHAVSYAINGYLSAYYKAHSPLIFFTSYLRFAKDKINPQEEVKELVNNAIEMNIKITGPSIAKLNKEFELFDDTIIFGFTNIKGVGESVYDKLISLIKQHNFDYTKDSVWKLLLVILSNININAAKAIITSGALEVYSKSRKELCFYLDIISNLTKKEKEYICTLDLNKFKTFQSIMEYTYLNYKLTKNRKEIFHNHINSLKNPPYSLLDNLQWIAENETYLFGVSITCNKSDAYYSEINTVSCQEYKNQPSKKKLSVIAEIQRISVIKTKKGQNPGMEMAFLELADSTGSIKSAVLFPEQYQKYKNFLNDEAVLVFTGTKSSKTDNSFLIERCVMPSS